MEDAIDGVHGSTTDLLGLRHTPSDLRVLALPFELRVLEAALHDVCKRLLDETMALELDAAPALEKLAHQVNSAALERVRRVKGRMNSLTQRVAAVRDELGKLLADDSDMRAMCLTMREQEAAAAEERHHSWGAGAADHRARASRRGVRGREVETNRHAPRRHWQPTPPLQGMPPRTPRASSSKWDGDDDDVTRAAADDRDVVALAFVSARGVAAASGRFSRRSLRLRRTPSTAPPPTSPSARHRRARRRRRARRSRRSDDSVSSDDRAVVEFVEFVEFVVACFASEWTSTRASRRSWRRITCTWTFRINV